MRRMEARRKKASAIRLRFSQSLDEPSAAVEPGERALDNPTLGQYDKSLGLIGPLDDLRSQATQGCLERVVELPSLIGRVGEQRLQQGIHPEQRRQQQDAAVAILDVGGMNDGVQQQAERIYQNVALLFRVADHNAGRLPLTQAHLGAET